MIAACPKCSARYRIDKERIRPEGVRLRCSRCDAIFRVRAPEPKAAPEPRPEPLPPADEAAPAAGPAVAEPAARENPPAPQPAESPPEPVRSERAGIEPAAEEAVDHDRLVVVADPVIDEGKATAAALAAWGLQPILVHDGVEAVLTIQRKLPRAAIIDAALPKMYGFQICELIKRNESLRHIQLVLVGAIYDRNRYRRNPTEIYGADAYLERPQIPDALWPILRGFGLPLGGGPPRPEPMPPRSQPAPVHREAPRSEPAPPVASNEPLAGEPTPDAVPVPALDSEPSAIPAAEPPPAASDPALDAEIAKAERLARIVVSDIVLYNQEKFDAAVRTGDVIAAMAGDLEEGRTLFAQRIDERVRAIRDFLTDELVRVAETRRSQ
jgi:predicted Zn finger-like uncharacterized protein